MKLQQFRLDGAHWRVIENMPENVNRNVVLVFGSRGELLNNKWFNQLSNKYPNSIILSASTAGEIFDNTILDNSITATALELEHTPVSGYVVNINDYSDGIEAGAALSKNIKRKDLSLLLLFCDGHYVNTDDVLKGIYKRIPDSVKIVGGLAGDGNEFQSTLVGLNGVPKEGNISILAFYGNHIKADTSLFSGWEPFGTVRTVTRSEGNKLFELDNRSALELYRNYLGKKATELPSSALLFPLSMRSKMGLPLSIRTILSIDEAEQSMTFAGDIPIGTRVRLMKFNPSKLIDSASSAAEAVVALNDTGLPQLSIIISCAGRRKALGPNTIEEIESVKGILGNKTITTGFYSYGQICARPGSSRSEVHNQSITLLTINEFEQPIVKVRNKRKDKFNSSENNFIIGSANEDVLQPISVQEINTALIGSELEKSEKKAAIPSIPKDFFPEESIQLRRNEAAGLESTIKQLLKLKTSTETKPDGGKEENTFTLKLKFKKVVKNNDSTNGNQLNGQEGIKLQETNEPPINLSYIKSLLNKWGLEIDENKNGKTSLENLVEYDRDIFLMDIQLQEPEGENLGVAINNSVITIPVIVMKNDAGDRHINNVLNDRGTDNNGQMTLFEKNTELSSPALDAAKTEIVNEKPKQEIYTNQEVNNIAPRHFIKSSGQPLGETVDLDYLKEITDGDEALLHETIRMFIDFTPEILENMWIYLESKDWQELSKAAHKFLSSLNFIGNIECKKLVKHLEINAASGEQTDELVYVLEKVTAMCEDAIAYLKSYLPPKIKALIAEDDPLLLNSLEFRLKKAGYEVISTTDGKEAIQKIEMHLPDIIITDFMIPSASGMEIVHFVKNKISKRIPVIMVSRVGLEKTIIDSFQLGADDFMTKPFSTNELLSRIKRLISPDFVRTSTVNQVIREYTPTQPEPKTEVQQS